MVLLGNKMNTLNVPSTLIDLLLLRNCLVFTRSLIRQEFSISLSEAIAEINSFEFSRRSEPVVGPHNFHSINYDLIEESKELCVTMNKNYSYEINPGNP